MKFLQFVYSILFMIVFILPINTQAETIKWEDDNIKDIIETYVKIFKSEDSRLLIDKDFKYLPQYNSATLLTAPFNSKNSSLDISLSVSLNSDEMIEQEENHIQIQSGIRVKNLHGIHFYTMTPEIIAEKHSFAKENYYSYENRSWAFCNNYSININSNIILFDEYLPESGANIVDRIVHNHLAKALSLTKICAPRIESVLPINFSIEIKSINGDVEIKKGEKGQYIPAKVGDILQKGDYIITGFESSASFYIPNLASLTIPEMTSFSVSQLFYDNNLAETAIKLQYGQIDCSVKPEKEIKANFQIITPTSTVGVRGTEFRVNVNKESGASNIYVFTGSVDVKSLTNNQQAIINADQNAYVSASGEISRNDMSVDIVKHVSYQDDNYQHIISILAIIIGFIVMTILITIYFKNKNLNKNNIFVSIGIIICIFTITIISILTMSTREEKQNSTFTTTENNETKKTLENSDSIINELESIENKLINNLSYPDDYAFAINLDPYSEKIKLKTEKNEWSEMSYLACFQLTDIDYNSGNCPFGSVEVFRLSLYNPDIMLDINENPMYENTYINLYQFADGASWLLEWPNGILPEETNVIDYNYLKNITETFMLQFTP